MENHKKIFSGSEITALAVKNILEENHVEYLERNDVQSAVRAGFGTSIQAVHIFVFEEDVPKVRELLTGFELADED
ncbi:putative signal transducing protein [Avrilella dinanensis]|uniref:DUF2007 domain-containing protein n=1 Tax=Avrilella dinanensis TaxID=2008672 RepID=A0A2M9R2K2_9FLAO|nr:DUF2007 domain-containing protein [Avrilella dinanensis]PJR03084.1 hypothetical protein CDL10_00190 [Avrilella dinanensis]